MEKKQASFAGSWYPAGASGCETEIRGFLKDKEGPKPGNFIGGIVPHAGWYFSGSIACRVIASLKADAVDTLVVFGMHMHPSSTPCILTRGSWETPFGDIEVDESFALEMAQKTKLRQDTPSIFPKENTIELQLPFIKYFFPDALIVPVGVPLSHEVADAIGIAAADTAVYLNKRVKVIGSTDLTHYGDNYGFAPKGRGEKALAWVRDENDRQAVEAIEAMDAKTIIRQGLNNHNLCCAGAVAASVSAVKKLGAVRAVKLDYTTSYEKSPGSSFVGYAGILFE